MPSRTPSCQLGDLASGETRRKSPVSGALRVTATAQWLHSTTGRIATDAHSWMTAVHWIDTLAAKGTYDPSQKHGPKWGPTTLAIAKEISALKECRPGIAYLTRQLRVSERTVKYHLAMLREAGLLAYRSIGTRISSSVRTTSVYERIIPAAFDDAHGIRTVGEGATRRPVGCATEHRKALGKLAKKAARKSRRRRPANSSSRRGRCTLMQGGTPTRFTKALSTVPSEASSTSGDQVSPTQQQPKRTPSRGRKNLNKVGRRYQLARQLIAQVPWLGRCQLPRVAWIVRHVADAGWTATEVQAIAEHAGPITQDDTRRPVGMLAHRLRGAEVLFASKEARTVTMQAWQESRAQEHARHDGYEHGLHSRAGSPASRRVADQAMAHIRKTVADHQAAIADAVDEVYADAGIDLMALSKDDIIQARSAASQDNGIILAALHTGMSERDARRLYSNHLVDRALNARRLAAATGQPAF